MAFVDRELELAFLNRIAARSDGQLVLLYGRRRVGKTVLLRHWAENSGLPHVYWAAEKESAALQRRKLFASLFQGSTPESQFSSWADCFTATAQVLGQNRTILIIDELPYAADVDPAFLSALQHAWDHQFKQSQNLLVLCGSHVNVMERLLNRQSPLYGRFTGQWHLQPFPFSAIRQFGPNWSAEERVAIYATIGGIPAYLEWLKPALSFNDNLRDVLLAPGTLFIAEPEFLLYDEVREPRNYLAILKAIGGGAHTLEEIQQDTMLPKPHLTVYLARLQQLRLVERRVPATIRPQVQHRSRQGRYHLADSYFRFYFRFLAPRLADITYKPERVLPVIREQLRPFVGLSAWEELSRQWVRWAADNSRLPFIPETIGSHWGGKVQVDVVAVSWIEKQILLGECKWQPEPIGQSVLRDLVEGKSPKLLQHLDKSRTPETWQLYYACFARGGFTELAEQYAAVHHVQLVDLAQLDQDLSGEV